MTRPDLLEFVFSKQHNHAGVEYAPGDSEYLPEAIADKLKRMGAGQVRPSADQREQRHKPKRR